MDNDKLELMRYELVLLQDKYIEAIQHFIIMLIIKTSNYDPITH